MPEVFVVLVEGNLVTAIRPETATEVVALGSSLQVGTELATNFRTTGRIDGRYLFADAEAARTFAVLCLQFTKALIEKRLRTINDLGPLFRFYLADEQPGAGA